MWQVPLEKVLMSQEVLAIQQDLRRRAKRSKTTRRTLVIFQLAVCYGLRVSEIIGLRLRDIRLGLGASIIVPSTLGKGSKSRRVPLVWDVDGMVDIESWVGERRSDGASDTDLLITTRYGTKMSRFTARQSFRRACIRIIGRPVTIHGGRHTFVSHALLQRPAIAVRDACGHAHLGITNVYAHVVRPEDTPGRLYA